jgi:purine-binding chemotaxis protein CheW
MRQGAKDLKSCADKYSLPWQGFDGTRAETTSMDQIAHTEIAHTMRQDLQGAGKYLAFWLGKEEFAVPVGRIREIIPWQEITPVPQAASYVLGVINLRGKVVPVMDLRLRLGMRGPGVSGPGVNEPGLSGNDRGVRACIVVMQPDSKRSRSPIGVVVDGVSEVLQIHPSELEDTAALASGWLQRGYVNQIAKIRGKVKLLLEIDRVLAGPADDTGTVETLELAGCGKE